MDIEKKKEAQRAFKEKNPDYFKEWKRQNYAKNKEKILAQNKEWRDRNKEGLSARQKEQQPKRSENHRVWRHRDLEKVRVYRREYVEKNKEMVRAIVRKCQLQRKYRLTPEDYDRMVAHQKNRCAICDRETTGKKLVVDHDHGNDMVRGLLCQACNQGIGLLGDDVGRLVSAAKYVRRWQKKHATVLKEA